MIVNTLELGNGKVEQRDAVTRFAIPPTTNRSYADAQWYDYRGLRRSRFPHRPPLRLSLRARFSHEADQLGGTAGFGFWNDPFTLSGGGILAAPNVVWFFAASPPNDQYLCEGVPGRGWKAASLNTAVNLKSFAALIRPRAASQSQTTNRLRAPAEEDRERQMVPGGLDLKNRLVGKPLMTLARRMIKASECLIEARMTDWHDYALEWRADGATFWVDGSEIHHAPAPPMMPLGFVTWVDNQYAVASEAGEFGFGLIENREERWMEIENLRIEPA